MKNLDGYGVLTTLAKKVGGPIKLAALAMGSGYLLLRGVEALSKKGVKAVKKQIDNRKKEEEETDLFFDDLSEDFSEDIAEDTLENTKEETAEDTLEDAYEEAIQEEKEIKNLPSENL